MCKPPSESIATCRSSAVPDTPLDTVQIVVRKPSTSLSGYLNVGLPSHFLANLFHASIITNLQSFAVISTIHIHCFIGLKYLPSGASEATEGTFDKLSRNLRFHGFLLSPIRLQIVNYWAISGPFQTLPSDSVGTMPMCLMINRDT